MRGVNLTFIYFCLISIIIPTNILEMELLGKVDWLQVEEMGET